MKIIVVFPTSTEAQFFSHPQINVEICGVGLMATAYSVTKIIAQHQPDWIIMAGIAGVYPESQYGVGDVVLVQSECVADFGFFNVEGFTHLADLNIDMDFIAVKELSCPYIDSAMQFSLAKSNSVNAAMAPFININGVDIENMEGAAFFHVCIAEQQKFIEIRSVSNIVNVEDDQWQMEASITALTQGLHQVISYLLEKE